MKFEQGRVIVIDDDADSRDSVAALVSQVNLNVVTYASAEDFLREETPERPACIVSDLRLLGMSGLELLRELRRREITVPVILLTAHADTPTIVQGMKLGAITALDKPCRESELWEAIATALQEDQRRLVAEQQRRELQQRLEKLTAEEVRILQLLVGGESNKSIASRLDLGLRTVENRRQSIMRKLHADSLPELVLLVTESKPSWLSWEPLPSKEVFTPPTHDRSGDAPRYPR